MKLSHATILSFYVVAKASAFHLDGTVRCRTAPCLSMSESDKNPVISLQRRSLVSSLFPLVLLTTPCVQPAFAGIDVSGLRVDGPGSANSIAEQLKSYDGSAATRVQEIRKASSEPSNEAATGTRVAPKDQNLQEETSTAATYAYRATPGFGPKLTKLGFAGERLRLEDSVVSPLSRGYLSVSFEFPSDWLQLDKMLGGIQYVDQRNGDKLYLLRTNLPPGTTLTDIPKKFFGDSIFDPKGVIVRSGVNIDDYKVKASEVLSDGSLAAAHRRLLIKYATVTGNGLRTERRMLVDAYEVDSVAYMLVTSSNAVKFEAKGRERETVEAIVDSFRIEKVQ